MNNEADAGLTPRARWKKFYRYIRVIRREQYKAVQDTVLYGTGAVFVPENGDDPHHVSPWDYVIKDKTITII